MRARPRPNIRPRHARWRKATLTSHSCRRMGSSPDGTASSPRRLERDLAPTLSAAISRWVIVRQMRPGWGEEGPQSSLRHPCEGPQSRLRPPCEGPQSRLRPPCEGPQSSLRPPCEGPQSRLRPPCEGLPIPGWWPPITASGSSRRPKDCPPGSWGRPIPYSPARAYARSEIASGHEIGFSPAPIRGVRLGHEPQGDAHDLDAG